MQKKKEANSLSKKDIRKDYLSEALSKLSIFFICLFLLSLLPSDFLNKFLEDWRWAFLAIAILLSIKPLKKFFNNEKQ